MDSASVQADFFLSSIALDFMYVRHALDDSFLNPFVHLVFILREPITAGFLLWLYQGFPYQVGSDMLCVAIPGVGKISQCCPGVFSLANPLVGVRHAIDRCRKRWRFFVPVSVILCHEAQGFKFHGQPSLPKSRFTVY